MPPKDVVVKVRMDRGLAARLERLARRRRVSRSRILREAIDLSEREVERRAALETLVAQARQDQERLRGKRPPRLGFRLP